MAGANRIVVRQALIGIVLKLRDIALQQGTVDVAANWCNDASESKLRRTARKNMVKAETSASS